MPTAHVNDIDINYQLEGDGPETDRAHQRPRRRPGVLGLPDAGDLLGAGYRVLRFDNRGIGATDKPAGPYTSRLLADDAKALVDHLGITGFHLMGVSMGGMIAQEYALAYPDDLQSADARLHLRRARAVLLADVLACGRTWRR